MKDRINQELEVGDTILVAAVEYDSDDDAYAVLVSGIISKFEDRGPGVTYSYFEGKEEYKARAFPSDVVKIDKNLERK